MKRPHLTVWRQIAGSPLPDRQPSSPEAFLGANHPLVRVVNIRSDLRRQSVVTAAALLVGIIGVASGARWGLPLLIAAAIVQLLLGAGRALLVPLQQELAWDLIIDGRGDLPLPALARERRRLQRPRRRACLAHSLEDLVQAAERWPTSHPTPRPIFDPRQIRAAAPDLRAIGALLHSNPVDVRGVALVARLLTLGDSPLYGPEPDELHGELESIRAELSRTDPGHAE